MRTIIQEIPIWIKVLRWIKLISLTSIAQIGIQAIGLISGILIIRLLPTQEYALYTLANTILGTMTILADGGISAGVMIYGGKVWSDRKKLGVVAVTGFELRRKFGVASLLIAIPILLYLLLHHGASLPMSILIIISLIPAFFAALSDSLLEIAPKLHQDVTSLQKNLIAANIGRFVLVTAAILIFPWAFIIIIGGGIPRIWANIQLKKTSTTYVDWNQKSDPIVRKDIITVVKKLLPNSIYYCVSSQTTIWLISIFGSTMAVAQIGALGRISIIFSIFSTLFQTLVVPRFARLSSHKNHLIKWFITLQVILFLFVATTLLIQNYFFDIILWLLGSKYYNLENNLAWAISSAVLSSVAGMIYGLLVSRNWILPPAISISINILSQIAIIPFVDFSTLKGAYTFTIIHTLIGILIGYISVYFFLRNRNYA